MSPSPAEFLEALRAAVVRRGGAEWLAGRVDGDSIVVLFRYDVVRGTQVAVGSIEGVRVQFDRFAAEILGPGQHHLDDVLGEAVLEIVEAHEPGRRLQVTWAAGLCAEPAVVLWRPDAVEAAVAER